MTVVQGIRGPLTCKMVHAEHGHHEEDKHETPVEHVKVIDHTTGKEIKSMGELTRFGVPRGAFPDEYEAKSGYEKYRRFWYNLFDRPVTWFRKTIVEPNRTNPAYYHRRFARVPTIDECYEGDMTCYWEAEQQYKRDREVDSEIIHILNKRKQHCIYYEGGDWMKNCHEEVEQFEDATTNFFLRYGEIGIFANTIDAYMRQKHRMIWERRNPDKVDFMYSKKRQENRYVLPMERGQRESVNLPDNTRSRYMRGLDMTYPQSMTKTPGLVWYDRRPEDKIEDERIRAEGGKKDTIEDSKILPGGKVL